MITLPVAVLELTLVLIFAAALGAVLYQRHCTRQSLQRVADMLDAAICGDFTNTTFDESMVSALEARLAQYLSASALSARNVAVEKDKLKELIGDISHQTKTPLTNLLLYNQLLAEQPLPESAAALVSATGAQAAKLQFLIEALVKISRLESGVLRMSPCPCEIQPVLQRAAEQALPLAQRKGITLTVCPCEQQALLDERWTTEAIFNLLDNAIKHTPAGGSVTVQTSACELFCRIDVIDTGIGIAEEEQARIFGRFYRANAAYDDSGVGIGLYLTREIAAGQGGYVKVSSRLGAGSTFSLFLPREAPCEILQNR